MTTKKQPVKTKSKNFPNSRRSQKPVSAPQKRPKSAKKPNSAPKQAQRLNLLHIGSPEYIKLQLEWAHKLKASGFTDLETLNPSTGEPHPQMTGSLYHLRQAALSGRETYFRRLTNYITHVPNWANIKLYHIVGCLYIDGISYRKMLPKLEALNYTISIWSIHKIVHILEAKASVWNRVNPEGLDFQADLQLLD